MPIGFIEGINGIFKIMKLAELMRHLGEDKRDGTADRFFPIGDDTFDWHRQFFEQLLDAPRSKLVISPWV